MSSLNGLGVDVIEISRVREALAQRPALAARLFTPSERAYCDQHADPAPHYAARFAAKEAVAKAVGRHLRWQEVEVVRPPGGPPGLRFTGQSADWSGASQGAAFLLSMSHSRDYAVAVVALVWAPPIPPATGLPPRVQA